MLILTTDATSQDFYIIPREWLGVSSSVEITDLDTNIKTTYASGSFTYLIDAYYQKITMAFNPVLKKETFYRAEVKNGLDTIYRDLIFCTDQKIYNYKTDFEQYTPQESTNEYIVL